MANWFLRSNSTLGTGWDAVPGWTLNTAVVVGAFVRQTAPAINSERVFICIIAGTTGATQPTWVLTRGAKTTDGTVTWQECTGRPAFNGDRASSPIAQFQRGGAVAL